LLKLAAIWVTIGASLMQKPNAKAQIPNNAMITEIEDYFTKGCGRCARFATPNSSTRLWTRSLDDLRRICRDLGLIETVKWGHPCYMYGNRNIALLGAFRGDCRITFFNAAPMQDPEAILEKPGPNAQTRSLIRFVDNAQVAKMEPVIRSYLREAISYAEAGIEPQKEKQNIALPDELTEALDSDPELAEAFHSLTPGRQKSYVLNLNAAKSSATRTGRITKFRANILAGKGATER
jgi:uncharacterized protein YdeI (YjbR/CyaY-like superfamily)